MYNYTKRTQHTENQQVSNKPLVTAEVIMELLESAGLQEAIESAISSIDADDAVELDFDSYSKTISVSWDTSGIVEEVYNAVMSTVETALKQGFNPNMVAEGVTAESLAEEIAALLKERMGA